MARQGASRSAASDASLTKNQRAQLATVQGMQRKAMLLKFRRDNQPQKQAAKPQPKQKGGKAALARSSAPRSRMSGQGQNQNTGGSWRNSFGSWALPSMEPTRVQVCSLRQIFTFANNASSPNPTTTAVGGRPGSWYVGYGANAADTLWFFPTGNQYQLVHCNAPGSMICWMHTKYSTDGNMTGYESDPKVRSAAFATRIRILQARYSVVVQGAPSTVGNLLLHRISANVGADASGYAANWFAGEVAKEVQTTRVIPIRGGAARFSFEAWVQCPNLIDSFVNADLTGTTPPNIASEIMGQGILARPAVGAWALGGYVLVPQAVAWGGQDSAPVITVTCDTVVQQELTLGNDHLATNTPQVPIEAVLRATRYATAPSNSPGAPRINAY